MSNVTDPGINGSFYFRSLHPLSPSVLATIPSPCSLWSHLRPCLSAWSAWSHWSIDHFLAFQFWRSGQGAVVLARSSGVAFVLILIRSVLIGYRNKSRNLTYVTLNSQSTDKIQFRIFQKICKVNKVVVVVVKGRRSLCFTLWFLLDLSLVNGQTYLRDEKRPFR